MRARRRSKLVADTRSASVMAQDRFFNGYDEETFAGLVSRHLAITLNSVDF